MEIKGKVGIITGAASGIGRRRRRTVQARHRRLALVDLADTVHEVASALNAAGGTTVVRGFQGDTTDDGFRRDVFETMRREHGPVNICVPAAGITRDASR